MHRQRPTQFRCYESLPYIILAVLILLYSGLWHVIITYSRSHSVQHINASTPSIKGLQRKDIPVKRMTTFAITDEERSTLSIVPVTGAAKHRIGAMHSTVSLIKPGCLGALANFKDTGIMVYSIKGVLVNGHVINIHGRTKTFPKKQLMLALWRNDKTKAVMTMKFNLKNKTNQIVTNTVHNITPDVFPATHGKWGSSRKRLWPNFTKALGIKPFQVKLYAQNSLWLVVQMGNYTSKVKNYLQVPLKDITWITIKYVKRSGMKLSLQEICVNITIH